MKESIMDYLSQVKVGRKQYYKNLAMFPLLSAYSANLEYLLLDEALAEGLLDVVEIDKDGSVPDIKVINKSPRMILILDGEELVGAKQNRVVNTTILVQANSTLVIPVSCVEEGRWSYHGPRFSSQERMMSPGLRAMKTDQVNYSIRSFGRFRSNQAAIWEEIAEKAGRREAESPSMAMSGIYEKDMPLINEYVRHFRAIDGQVGAVFMINGRVVGMDSLGKPGTFSKVFKKLLQSYALDAIDWSEPEKEHKALKSEVTKFLKASALAQIESHTSVGLGIDCRLESEKIAGFALVHRNTIIHLSVFVRNDQGNGKRHTFSMRRFTQRRRNRVY